MCWKESRKIFARHISARCERLENFGESPRLLRDAAAPIAAPFARLARVAVAAPERNAAHPRLRFAPGDQDLCVVERENFRLHIVLADVGREADLDGGINGVRS